MLSRYSIKFFAVFVAMSLASFPGYGQEMPAGNVIVTTACTVNDGHTIADVIEESRSNVIGEDGPNLVFFRQPIAGNNLPSNLLMRVVYWSNLEHWASSPGPNASANSRINRMLTCDNSNRIFSTNRSVGQNGSAYAQGENDESLVTTRACLIKQGNTIADVYGFLDGFNDNFRDQGDTTLMQLSHQFMGPRDGVEMGRAVIIRLIGEDGIGLARRLDMMNKPTGPGDDAPIEACRDMVLWTSYVTHWGL